MVQASNSAIAGVSSSGLVKAVAPGTATITATNGTTTANCVVTSNVTFIQGFVTTSSNLNLPAYWKNGVLTMLPTTVAQPYGQCDNPAIVGTDIYIGGYITNAAGTALTPVYWKNGVLTQLTLPSGDSYNGSWIQPMFDSSGNMYIRGTLYTTGNTNGTLPGYWLNGAWTALSMILPDGTATAGSINGQTIGGDGTIYWNGYLVDPTTNLQVPVYWSNGAVTVVSLGSIATASVKGGYVSAILTPPDMPNFTILLAGNDSNMNPIPAYSINGTVTPISTGPWPDAVVWWAWLDGGNGSIYASGNSANAVYWVNWQIVALPAPTGYTNGGENGINRVDQTGDIYNPGQVWSATSPGIPVYWLNGSVNELSCGSSNIGGNAQGMSFVDF